MSMLSPVHTGDKVDSRLYHRFVAGLSKVDCRRFVRLVVDRVAVDTVAKVEHVQLDRLCRK